jgi:hypothetical protein
MLQLPTGKILKRCYKLSHSLGFFFNKEPFAYFRPCSLVEKDVGGLQDRVNEKSEGHFLLRKKTLKNWRTIAVKKRGVLPRVASCWEKNRLKNWRTIEAKKVRGEVHVEKKCLKNWSKKVKCAMFPFNKRYDQAWLNFCERTRSSRQQCNEGEPLCLSIRTMKNIPKDHEASFLKQSLGLCGELAPTQQWRSAQLAPTEKLTPCSCLGASWCLPMLVLKKLSSGFAPQKAAF